MKDILYFILGLLIGAIGMYLLKPSPAPSVKKEFREGKVQSDTAKVVNEDTLKFSKEAIESKVLVSKSKKSFGFRNEIQKHLVSSKPLVSEKKSVSTQDSLVSETIIESKVIWRGEGSEIEIRMYSPLPVDSVVVIPKITHKIITNTKVDTLIITETVEADPSIKQISSWVGLGVILTLIFGG